MTDMWAYRDPTWTQSQYLVGYHLEAIDGSIGRIDKATYDASDAYVVVDTGFWIFVKKRLIPAGAIVGVNYRSNTVHVGLTKHQIKSAPDYDGNDWNDAARTRHSDYYRAYVR
jgi:hypothetical protein